MDSYHYALMTRSCVDVYSVVVMVIGGVFLRAEKLWKSLGSYLSLLPISSSGSVMTSGWRCFKARDHIKLTSFHIIPGNV